MLDLNYIIHVKKSEKIKGSIVTETEKRTCNHFSCSVGEVVRCEFYELGLNKDEKNVVGGDCSSLTKLLKKGFDITLWYENNQYVIDITMCVPNKHCSKIASFSRTKQEGIKQVFRDAENWAGYFIYQFNSDQENTL